MASTTALRSVFLKEAWRPTSGKSIAGSFPFVSAFYLRTPNLDWDCKHRKIRNLCFSRTGLHVNSSNYEEMYLSASDDNSGQDPPQEAVLKAISEVSKKEGRVGQTTNIVMGGTVANDSTNEWLALDQKVNSYPTERGFTAIGTGGDDFVEAMVVAVESVLRQPIPEGQVKQKVSSGGKYVSVNIGPVQVVSSEQVQAVYNAMRRDDRMKYFL